LLSQSRTMQVSVSNLSPQQRHITWASFFNTRNNMFGFRNGKGAIVANGAHVADTLQCVHCGCHWIPVTGSGQKRGWCTACVGPCCGKEGCMTCIPFEAKLEIEEGTRKHGDKYFTEYVRLLQKS